MNDEPSQDEVGISLGGGHAFAALAFFVGVCLCWSCPYPPASKRAGISALLLFGSPVALKVGFDVRDIPYVPQDLVWFGPTSLLVTGAAVYLCLFQVAIADFFQGIFHRKLSIGTIILTLAIPTLFVLAEAIHEALFIPMAVLFLTTCGLNAALCIMAIRAIKKGTAATS